MLQTCKMGNNVGAPRHEASEIAMLLVHMSHSPPLLDVLESATRPSHATEHYAAQQAWHLHPYAHMAFSERHTLTRLLTSQRELLWLKLLPWLVLKSSGMGWSPSQQHFWVRMLLQDMPRPCASTPVAITATRGKANAIQHELRPPWLVSTFAVVLSVGVAHESR